jgi:voltage-gated potassium channel
MPQVAQLNVIERRLTRFLSEPPSVRTAAAVIVSATAAVVIVGGVLMRLLDHGEYSDIWVGMWWALQTVTTVGYGDVTPEHASGRIVAVFVMLQGIAFLAITTAAITSTFVARASRERERARAADEDDAEVRIDTHLGDIDQRLSRIERMLSDRAPGE